MAFFIIIAVAATISSVTGNVSHTPVIPNIALRIKAVGIITASPLITEITKDGTAFSMLLKYTAVITFMPAKKKPVK